MILHPQGFYVYIWSYPDGRPFYVGKGRGTRYRECGNYHSRRVAAKIRHGGGEPIVAFLPMPDESSALVSEAGLIKAYGRRDLGTGLLCNRSDGGEGPTKPSYWSPERRAEWSQRMTSQALDPVRRARNSERMKALWASADHRDPTVQKIKAAVRSAAVKQRVSASNRAYYKLHPERRKFSSELFKTLWADPAYRERMSHRKRRYYGKRQRLEPAQ